MFVMQMKSAEKRIAELEAELEVMSRNGQELYKVQRENQRLREAALLALRCKTLPEAAQAKAALEAALKGE